MSIDTKLNESVSEPPSKRESSIIVIPDDEDEEMPLEYRLLQERTGLRTSLVPQGIHQKLVRFGDESKEKIKPGENFDVLDYWKKMEENSVYKDLIGIASVILANPASKHEITKEFAAFSLAVSQLRDEISTDNLNSFLLVSGNLEMLKDL